MFLTSKAQRLIIAIGLPFCVHCATPAPIAKVDKVRQEAILYSTGDARTALPAYPKSVEVKESIQQIEVSLKKNPKDVDKLLNLAHLYLMSGKDTEAQAAVQKVLRIDLKNVSAKKLLAQIFLRSGKVDMALVVLNGIDAAGSRDSEALNLLALVHLKRDERALAMQTFRKALEVNPSDVAVRMNLGVLFLKHRQIREAAVQFERVLKIVPNHIDAKIHLAIVKTSQGQLKPAEKLFEEALALHQDNPIALYNFAVLRKHQERFDDSLQLLKRYLASNKLRGGETSEVFQLISSIEREKEARGEKITDEEIKELAKRVGQSTDEGEVQTTTAADGMHAEGKPKQGTQDAELLELEKALKGH